MSFMLRKLKMAVLIVATYRNFPMIFADYAGLYRSNTMIVTTWSGVRYRIRSHRVTKTDFYVLNESWLYKLHAKMAQRFIRPGATVLDIGGHIGAFTIYAAMQQPDTKVYAFEPDPKNFAALSENIKLNHLESRVFAFNKAVASKEGSMSLWESTTDTGQHTAYAERLEYEKNQHVENTVPTTTLQKFFDEHHIERCDLIKIDCEGMEYDILYNLPEAYLERIKAFSIEHHWAPGGDYKELAEYLKKHGYTVSFPSKEFALIYAWRE